MIWIYTALFLILIYSIVIKSNSKTLQKCFSFLSGVFFIITISPLLSEKIFNFLIKISLFLPFVLGMLSAILNFKITKALKIDYTSNITSTQ